MTEQRKRDCGKSKRAYVSGKRFPLDFSDGGIVYRAVSFLWKQAVGRRGMVSGFVDQSVFRTPMGHTVDAFEQYCAYYFYSQI